MTLAMLVKMVKLVKARDLKEAGEACDIYVKREKSAI